MEGILHSQISLTMDAYTHVLSAVTTEAIGKLDDLWAGR
jgi:hypothetical protein